MTLVGLNFDTSAYTYGLFTNVVENGACSASALPGGRQTTSLVVDPYCTNTSSILPTNAGVCTVAATSLRSVFTVLSQITPATYYLCSLKNGIPRPTGAVVNVVAPCIMEPLLITVTAGRDGPAQTVTVRGAYFSTVSTRQFALSSTANCASRVSTVAITASGTDPILVELSFNTLQQTTALAGLYLCQSADGSTNWTQILLARVNVGLFCVTNGCARRFSLDSQPLILSLSFSLFARTCGPSVAPVLSTVGAIRVGTFDNTVLLTGANLTIDQDNIALLNNQFYLTDTVCTASTPKIVSNTVVSVTGFDSSNGNILRLRVDGMDLSLPDLCDSYALAGTYTLCGRWHEVMTWIDMGQVTLERCVAGLPCCRQISVTGFSLLC